MGDIRYRATWCGTSCCICGCPLASARYGAARRLRGGQAHLGPDLVLNGLQVGLVVGVDACVSGHPEKRLTGPLRIHDFLALTHDAERALCGSLVGLSLTVGDNLGDFSGLNLRFIFGFQFIVNLLVAVVGDLSQFFTKLIHAVECAL